jgi:CBS domain-containing protein
MRHVTVRQVMTRTVRSVRPDTDFQEIAGLLYGEGIGAVPVLDEKGRLVGVVSEADLLLKEEFRDGRLRHRRDRRAQEKAGALTAAELMTTVVDTVGPDTTVPEAARVLRSRGRKWAPVADKDQQVVGIVTRSDLLRVFLRPDAELHDEIVAEVLGRIMWLEPGTVDVGVEDGIVTLAGQLESAEDAGMLVRLVNRIDGVVGVVNQLSCLVAVPTVAPVTHPPL